MPARDAAGLSLATRLESLARAQNAALKCHSQRGGKGHGKDNARKRWAKRVLSVHALRVAVRRAEAAISAFEPIVGAKAARKLARRLRRLRRVAGRVRDHDVRLASLAELASARSAGARAAVGSLRERIARDRDRRARALCEQLEHDGAADLRRRTRKIVDAIGQRDAGDSPDLLRDVAARSLAPLLDAAASAAAQNLTHIDNLHDLRLCLKRLRYALEIFACCIGGGARARSIAALAEVQQRLGEVNDEDILAVRAAQELHELKGRRDAQSVALRRMVDRLRARHLKQRDAAQKPAIQACADLENRVLRPLRVGLLAAASPPPAPSVPAPSAALIETKPTPREAHAGAQPARNGTHHPSVEALPRRRVAAIDVGSNSVRLIIAEAAPDGSYRVLDDEKEVTRLARGLHEHGRLDPEAVEHSVATVARMQAIARGYGAGEVRVVGTSAARDAADGADLSRRIRERTGLNMEIISGDDEALLAYRSAARAFDLSNGPSLVFDVGGGSTEIVLAAGVHATPSAGVIERVHSLPLGAVRLTEMFGGPKKASGSRYEELCEHVRRVLKREVGKVGAVPLVAVATGGTLTTLGAMVQHRRLGAAAGGLFSGAVQGVEIARADLKHTLALLRDLPTKERARIPGLPADRADIIVAGLVVVDAVMQHFAVNRLRVHEGGIRDGLLLQMVKSPGGSTASADVLPIGRVDPMRGVERFARACDFEEPHSRHVTRLALSLFDQVMELRLPLGVTMGDRERGILEAAALLHDVGYLINYAQHHKHSYHLIVHADLPGFTHNQVQLIANVARYHRAAEPKRTHATFATLGDEDQRVVRILSGILRIADGLDRTHTQSVFSLKLTQAAGDLRLIVRAREEPSVDLWGAARKSGLFESLAGQELRLEWSADTAPQPGSIRVQQPGKPRSDKALLS